MKKLLLSIICAGTFFITDAQIVYVNQAATGANTGANWADAYTDLQTALTATSSGQIWVAQGDYKPGLSGQNTATFLLKNNVQLYGGFVGGETLLSQRNPSTNYTILSGDLDNNFSWGANDAYHVVTSIDAGSTAVLDGFYVMKGNAAGGGDNDFGAGIYIRPNTVGVFSPRISNCFITNNLAANGGSGIAVISQNGTGGDAVPYFINCYINDNLMSGTVGGAAYIYALASGSKASPKFENCLFSNNTAGSFGNHLYFDCTLGAEVHANITGCTFYGNNTGTELYYNSGGSAGNVTLNNNILYQMDIGSDVTYIGNNNCTASPLVIGSNNSDFNPFFINPGAGNFRLQCGSGAIGYGDNTYVTSGETDLVGNVRISGANVDIGAYEVQLPNVGGVASPSNTICFGETITLIGSGALSYSWSGGATDNVAFSPSVSESFTVTGTDGSGCSNTFVINVTVNPLPNVMANASSTGICQGTPITLYGSGAVSYLWDGGVIDNNAFVPSVSGYYTVSGTDANGCVNTAQTYIDVEQNNLTNAGPDLNFCSGVTDVNLSPTSFGGSVVWSTLGTGNFLNPNFANTIYYPSAGDDVSGLVKIVMTSVYNYCANETDTLNVFIHSLPTFNLGSDYTICQTDSILLQTNVSGGTPPYLFNWSNGQGTISTFNSEYYTPADTISLSLYLLDTYGCVATDTVKVNVNGSEQLSGTISVGAGVLTDGEMVVLKYVPFQQAFDTMFVMPFSAGSGTFSFNAFPYGQYYIKILPDTNLYPDLIPTYYGNAFQWDSATVINHNCDFPFVANINMIQLLGGTGTGQISGTINEDFGFGNRIGGNNNHIMIPGGPLKGIDVKLGKNPGGGIQARTTSNDFGNYTFDSIPNGNYNVYIDIPGLPMDSFYVVNISGDSVANLVYYADSNSIYPILPVTVGIHQYATESTAIGLYPNPARNYTSILFETTKSNTGTLLRVVDISGKTIYHMQLNHLPKGKHQYQISFAEGEIQAGIYFVEVITDNGKAVSKLVIQ